MNEEITELRARIDALDEQLVGLLAERIEVVHRVARHKTDEASVRAPDRVQQVVDKVRALAEHRGIPADLVERLWRLLIAELTELELERVQALRRADGPSA